MTRPGFLDQALFDELAEKARSPRIKHVLNEPRPRQRAIARF